MAWIIFALLTAFFESLKDVLCKKNLKKVDEYVVSWSLSFFSLLVLLPLLLLSGIPTPGRQFWVSLLVSGSLNVGAILLYMKAIKQSDLSISVPMVTFTPAFLLVTSPLIVGEFPSITGLLGILSIVTGSYVLNLGERSRGPWAPFRALLKEKGARYMAGVAFLWSITANFDKLGVLDSSPVFWAVGVNLYVSSLLLVIMLARSRGSLQEAAANYRVLLVGGLAMALVFVFQMTAIQLALVAYVLSLKRTSVFFSVLAGTLIFKERGWKERLPGSLLMIAGVILITIFS